MPSSSSIKAHIAFALSVEPQIRFFGIYGYLGCESKHPNTPIIKIKITYQHPLRFPNPKLKKSHPNMHLSYPHFTSRPTIPSITTTHSPLRTPFQTLPMSHFPKPHTLNPIPNPPKSPSFLPSCRIQSRSTTAISSDDSNPNTNPTSEVKEADGKNFWGAVSLIIGTAVGPGMLGLPSATIKSGPLPSTIAIILSWVYVISSILLVAELSFAAMEEDGVEEVSFTGLAINALGSRAGAFVAVIYACLSFSLLVACVSGIASLVVQWFPSVNLTVANAIFPCITGVVIGFFPFKAIDAANRLLCILMLLSITALVAVGSSVGRTNVLSSFGYASWSPATILPAIPVTVLTLGFHVITPFVCKIVGKTAFEARKAILFGGAVPLVMVLAWNVVVLGLAGTNKVASEDPIQLLLSVNSSALPAVQGFAFSALATSLIGYAVSFPKQLIDTLDLIFQTADAKRMKGSLVGVSSPHEGGRVGFAVYSRSQKGIPGKTSFSGSMSSLDLRKEALIGDSTDDFSCENGKERSDLLNCVSSDQSNMFVTPLVIGSAVLVASFFRTAFSSALNFAGVYANCFLFGILPPAMAWIHRSKKKLRYPKNSTSVMSYIAFLSHYSYVLGL